MSRNPYAKALRTKPTIELPPAQFAAFAHALEAAQHPSDKLRLLMRDPIHLWNEAATEPVPDDMRALLDKLR